MLNHAVQTGIRWNFVATMGHQVASYVLMIVLARLLSPRDFGLISLVFVLVKCARMYTNDCFSAALQQRQNPSSSLILSVFWLNIFVGLCFAALLFFASPYVAAFFAEDELAVIAKVFALDFLLSSIGVVPRALLQKQLAFKRVAVLEIGAVVIAGSTACVLAIYGYGYWSLVLFYLLHSFLSSLFAFILAKLRLQMVLDLAELKTIFSYSIHLIGFNTVNFLSRNMDDILVGKFFGAASLGLYSRAYTMMLVPVSHLCNVPGRVLFPFFSTIQHDKDRIRTIYLETMGMLALIALPGLLILFVISHSMVNVVFGGEWLEMVPFLQVFCLIGIVQVVVAPVGWIYMSLGRTDTMFKVGAVNAILTLSAFCIGILMGSGLSVAWCYLGVNVLMVCPLLLIPFRWIALRLQKFAAEIFPAVLLAAAVAIALFLSQPALEALSRPVLRLGVEICGSFFFVWGCAAAFRLKAYRQLVLILRGKQGLR